MCVIVPNDSFNLLLYECILSRFNYLWLYATLWTVTCQVPLSMGIPQARILEWVAMPYSKGSSWPRDQTHVSYISCIADGFFTASTNWEAQFAEGNGTPLQYSCLENPMDRGVWWAALHGVAKSRARLSDFTFTFYFHALEKDMTTHSSILAWRIPGVEELLSMGLHKVGHDWSDLAAMINNVSHPLVFLLAFHITYFV